MISPDAFDALVTAVAKLNDLDEDTAGDVVAAVGDVHQLDPQTGKVVADLDGGRRLLVTWPE